MIISYYSKCYTPKERKDITIDGVIDLIKSDKLKQDTNYLRNEKDKKKRDYYKIKNLPAVTFQGKFKTRANNKLESASGLATLDIDHYEGDVTGFKKELACDEHVFLIFISPSGGLKVVIKIPLIKNDGEYKIVYHQLIEYYKKYAPKSDEKTKDISRLCFLSYDPDIYVNLKANDFNVDWKKSPPKPINKEGSKIDLDKVLKGVNEGNRDDTAFRLACRYKGKKLSKEETMMMVLKWNETNKPPLQDIIIKKCVNSAFRYEDEVIKEDIKLSDLHKLYCNLLHVEDTKRIDVVLAVALSSKLPGIPLWLILVGASGDMKSVQLNSFGGENFYVLHNLTSKTLVNGHRNKEKYPDLAPALDNKIIIIPDMAQILKLPPSEKGELWGQLRDLYDGLAGKASGMGCSTRYSGLKVTLLAGSTPAIDGQILVHQDLGTRELIYRTSGNKQKMKLMEKCFENESMEKEIGLQLKNITTEFIEQKKITREEYPKEVLDEIKNIAIYITYMRATAEFDNYSNELRNLVYPEEPTRIAKQLKRLYICLKSLEEDYSDYKAFEILWHVARSSAFPIRIKIFDYLLKHNGNEYSTSQLSEVMMIGKSTAKRECLVMENMGMVKCRRQETSYPDKFYEFWQINMKKIETFLKLKQTVHEYIRDKREKKHNNIYMYYISLDGFDYGELDQPIDIECLTAPTHIACKACQAPESHFSYKGNYFCSKDCIESYKVNKGTN